MGTQTDNPASSICNFHQACNVSAAQDMWPALNLKNSERPQLNYLVSKRYKYEPMAKSNKQIHASQQ